MPAEGAGTSATKGGSAACDRVEATVEVAVKLCGALAGGSALYFIAAIPNIIREHGEFSTIPFHVYHALIMWSLATWDSHHFIPWYADGCSLPANRLNPEHRNRQTERLSG